TVSTVFAVGGDRFGDRLGDHGVGHDWLLHRWGAGAGAAVGADPDARVPDPLAAGRALRAVRVVAGLPGVLLVPGGPLVSGRHDLREARAGVDASAHGPSSCSLPVEDSLSRILVPHNLYRVSSLMISFSTRSVRRFSRRSAARACSGWFR